MYSIANNIGLEAVVCAINVSHVRMQVLPLENKMRSPRYAKRIIMLGMSAVIFLFIEFGTLGYMVYGESIQASISFNLVSNSTAERM